MSGSVLCVRGKSFVGDYCARAVLNSSTYPVFDGWVDTLYQLFNSYEVWVIWLASVLALGFVPVYPINEQTGHDPERFDRNDMWRKSSEGIGWSGEENAENRFAVLFWIGWNWFISSGSQRLNFRRGKEYRRIWSRSVCQQHRQNG